MRLLLNSYTDSANYVCREIESYLAFGLTVVANTYFWTSSDIVIVKKRFESDSRVSLLSFDPGLPQAFLDVLLDRNMQFNAIVCPPHVHGLTSEVIKSVANAGTLDGPLRAIGCPNDSITHLSSAVAVAAEHGVVIIHTPGVHARSVAEYTLCQIGFHARRMGYFYETTGQHGAWPHQEALSSTHLLHGKTLGVIGGSGKDGAAVISLAINLGLRVVAVGSGSSSGAMRMRRLGATVAVDLDELLRCSDFISVNCRSMNATLGLIGAREIALMKSGVIVINPAGAEILDKQAILNEFGKPPSSRRIGALVLDMPFGGKRDSQAFATDPDNAALKGFGVLFTPRMAGYTVEGRLQAITELAAHLDRYLRLNDQTVPIANRRGQQGRQLESGGDDMATLLEDIIYLVHEAGAETIRLRESGLAVTYKNDGSPTTNADLVAETIVKDGLRGKGYSFRFAGEESEVEPQNVGSFQIVIDGIDGTRNFRDGNYGWGTSVAVVVNGETVMGVVYEPLSDQTYFAKKGGGAFIRSGQVTKTCEIPRALPRDFSFSVGSFRVAGSATIKRQIIEDIKTMGGRGREWGCVALSICAVARGGLGAFIQSNSHSHDHLAAIRIAQEAGADVVRHSKNGSEREDIIVSHPTLCRDINGIFDARTNRSGLQ